MSTMTISTQKTQHTYDFCVNPYVINNFPSVIEQSVYRALFQMYEDGVLILKPKDARLVTEQLEPYSDTKSIDRVLVSFYEKDESI